MYINILCVWIILWINYFCDFLSWKYLLLYLVDMYENMILLFGLMIEFDNMYKGK